MAVNINVPSQVKTYANLAAFPATGALKTIYIAEDTNKTYRWTGSVYTEISASAAMTWGAIGGTLSNQTDLQNALDAKVPTSRTLTINGVTQDLSANRTFTISTGITIGSTAIASGTVGRILFEGAGNVVQESSSLFWDNTNGTLEATTTADNLFGLRLKSTTGQLKVKPYLNSSYGVLMESRNAADSAYLPMSYSSSKHLFLDGNVIINSTSDAGFKLDVNGTARVQTSLLLGSSLINANTTAFPLQVNFTNAASNVGAIWRNGSSTGYTSFRFYNNINDGGRALEMGYSGSAFSGSIISGGIAGESAYITTTGAYPLQFGSNNLTRFIIASSGNLLVNTTTDAGFRLDVNGTARVSGNLTLGAEVFGTTNTYFNGPSVNTGTLWLRFNAVNSNGNFTASGIVQGNGVSASGTNSQLSSTGAGVQGVVISNTATSTNWRIEGHRTTSGALEFKNDLTNPVLNLFSSRNVGIGTFTDIASAKLIIESTTQGFLPPRMTTTQKNAIASPAAGLMVYDTTLNVISYYNGSMWI